jgi:hypothetical protein
VPCVLTLLGVMIVPVIVTTSAQQQNQQQPEARWNPAMCQVVGAE